MRSGNATTAGMVRVSLAAPGLIEAVTDCLAVAHGAAAMSAGREAPLLQGPMGDVRARYVRRLVVVRRVSSRPGPDPAVGLGPGVWLANPIADGAAVAAARRARVEHR